MPCSIKMLLFVQVQEKRKELQQGEMHNYYSSETRSLQLDARTAALQDWKLFSDADKAVYQAQAAGMPPVFSSVLTEHHAN